MIVPRIDRTAATKFLWIGGHVSMASLLRLMHIETSVAWHSTTPVHGSRRMTYPKVLCSYLDSVNVFRLNLAQDEGRNNARRRLEHPQEVICARVPAPLEVSTT